MTTQIPTPSAQQEAVLAGNEGIELTRTAWRIK